MKSLIRILSATVARAPAAVLVAALALTAVFAFFAPQAQRAVGNEGFSPDSEEFLALLTINEIFTESSEVAIQVVFDGGTDDILTADGLRSYVKAREAIYASRAPEVFVERPEGDVVGFMDLVLFSFAEQGIDPLAAGDEQIKQAFAEGLEQLPPEIRERFVGLLSTRADLSVPASPAGLMVVFMNLAVLEDDPDLVELQAIQVDMAEHLEEATAGEVVTAEPFSFALLFANQEEFEAEVGRLFAAAFVIILVLLGFVFWMNPKGRLRWLGAGRRAAADVLLALGVIIMSITWMNGIGVLLGPGYLGVIGAFSELLMVIPILLIGLGVDYAIHLTSRYREEVARGSDVATAAVRASRTVGVALVLATVTTSVGFLTNYFSPVTAIADFGIMVAVGITSAFVLMLTFVPSARILLDRRAEAGGRLPTEAMGRTSRRMLPRAIGSTSVLASRLPAVMVTVALILGGLGVWGWSRLDTRFSFTDFVPEGSPLLATFETITEEFGGGFGERTQVLIEGEVATPMAHNALALAHRSMADTPHVLVFEGRAQAESPLSVLYLLTTPPEEGGDPALYDPEFAALAAGLGMQPDLTVAGDADVAALYRAAEAVAPEMMRRVIAEENGAYRYVDVSVATQAGEQGTVAVRDRSGTEVRGVSFERFMERAASEAATRAIATVASRSSSDGSGRFRNAVSGLARKFWTITSWTWPKRPWSSAN